MHQREELALLSEACREKQSVSSFAANLTCPDGGARHVQVVWYGTSQATLWSKKFTGTRVPLNTARATKARSIKAGVPRKLSHRLSRALLVYLEV